MSGLSNIPEAHLEKSRELFRVLRSTVRDWIERSAVAQKNDHIRANLPYIDLMFAFGFANLGDHATANKLVEAAQQVLVGPIPPGGTPQEWQAVCAAVVRNFLFKTFKYRVDQVLAGKSHTGPMSPEVLGELKNITKKGTPVRSTIRISSPHS